MEAEYLKSTVTGALVEGLAAVARLQPADPVDFLGKWLIRHADYLEQGAKRDAPPLSSTLPAAAAASASGPRSAQGEHEHKEGHGEAAAASASTPGSDVFALLASCAEIDDAVLAAIAHAARQLSGATAAYIAERVAGKGGEEEGGDVVKYIAASEGHEFMLSNTLHSGEGVTWRTWVLPTPEEEDAAGGEGEGGDASRVKAPLELPVIHISNVLRDADVHFYQLPRPGAYVAVPIQYGSLLHENALPAISAEEDAPAEVEAEAAPEGEDGAPPASDEEAADAEARAVTTGARARKAAIPAGNALQRSLALCVDTLGQNRDVTGAQEGELRRLAGAFKDALLRTEQAAYEAEYAAAKAAAKTADGAAAEAADKASAHASAAEAEAAAAIEAAGGEEASEELKAYIKANAALKAARLLVDERISLIAEIQRRRIQPKPDGVKLLQVVWYLLSYSKEQLGDPYSPDPRAFVWNNAKKHLGSEFVSTLRAYDPEVVHKVLPYQKVDALRAGLSSLSVDELNRQSVAFGALHAFASAALDAREAAVAKRKRDAEEAEAKARAEAEAKAAEEAAAAEAAAQAAAEAAEAAAAAAGEEGGGEDAAAAAQEEEA